MIKSCALFAAIFAGLMPQTALSAEIGGVSHSARSEASYLRAQLDPNDDPAWYVERSDNTSLRLSVLMQARYMYSIRERGFISADDIQTTGFSMPRTQVALDGTIISSQFNYRISFDAGDAELSRGSRNGGLLAAGMGSLRLLDAYAQYNFTGQREGYYFKFGQFQSIVMSEEAVDSSNQLAVERSLVSEIFGPGYTQGVALGRVLSNYAWEFSVNDGGRTILVREADNTSVTDPDGKDLGLSLRFDWKLQGDWDQFADFTSWRGSNRGMKLGAGVMYQFAGQFNPATTTISLFPDTLETMNSVTWTVDYQYEGDGWNFFAAYIGTYVDFDFVDGGTFDRIHSIHHGFVAQGGWFITEDVEWYARAELMYIDEIFRDSFSLPQGEQYRIATIGVNKYLLPDSHAAKISADLSYAFDPLTVLTVGSTTLGLPDPGTTGFTGLTDEELLFRLQLQLLF